MRKIFGIFTLVMVFAILLHPSAQSAKAMTKQFPKKTTSSMQREIPRIKCDDPDSMAACKSFKQLVEAKDKDVLEAIVGKKLSEDKHIAYVCFSPRINGLQVDRFRIIDFDQPSEQHFFKHPTDPKINQEAAFRFYLAGQEKISLDAMTSWYIDYSDSDLYDFGEASIAVYQMGVMSNLDYEFGYWRKARDSPRPASLRGSTIGSHGLATAFQNMMTRKLRT